MSGVVAGMMQFGEVIARKDLNADGLAITLYTMTMPVAALTSLWWARLVEGRDQRKLLIFVGSIGFLFIASGAFLATIQHLIIFSFVYFLAFALIGPSENRILQQYVASNKTGSTFGFASGMRMGVAALVTGSAGMWMEHVEHGYRNLYPIAALVGFVALGFLASIKTGGKIQKDPIPINRRFILGPLKDVVRLLKTRKDYLRFEIAFMIYGIAFMMTLPVVPLFLVDDLGLGYDKIGLARGTIAQLVMIAGIPIFGRIFDKTTPHKMATIIFVLLSGYPLLVLSCKSFTGSMLNIMLLVTFAYFGIVMSGVMVLWNLSSIRFSGNEDAGVYHSVHVAATGLRGSFAPLLGYFVMSQLGKTTALITSSCLFFASGLLMILMRKIDYWKGDSRSLRVNN